MVEPLYQCQFVEITGISSTFRMNFNQTQDGRYKCSQCSTTLSNIHNLKIHMNLHTGKYRCEPCKHNFSRTSQLNDHLATKSHKDTVLKQKESNESIICPLCKKQFPEKCQLQTHLQSNACTMPNTINQNNGNVISNATNNTAQIDPHPENNSMSLSDRIEQFKTSSNLNENISTQIQVRDPKSFNLEIEKPSQTPTIKTNPMNLVCEYCDYKASSEYTIRRHTIGHTAPMQCPKCLKGYTNVGEGKAYFQKHVTTCDGSVKWSRQKKNNATDNTSI